MRKLKVGLIGLGRLGREHAVNIATRIPNMELVAVCARHGEKAEAVARELDIPAWYDSAEELCNDPDVEAVIVCTNTPSHVDMIELAMNAGKHVFCDKPLSQDVSDCLRAEKIIAAHPGLSFMLGFMRRFDHSYQMAKQKIDRGDIGDIIMVRCNSQDPAAVIEGTLEYAPRSGGIFIDLAVHDIDLVCWLTGSEPERLWATGGAYAYPQFAEWEDGDNVSVLMQNKNGTMASLFAGREAAHGSVVETEIIGTKGALRIAAVPSDSRLEVMSSHGVCQECYQDWVPRWHDAYIAELEYFADCVISGRKPSPTAEEGTRATKIAAACRDSFRKNKMVDAMA